MDKHRVPIYFRLWLSPELGPPSLFSATSYVSLSLSSYFANRRCFCLSPIRTIIVPKKIKFRRNTKVEEKERISRWTSVLEFGVKLRTVEVEPSGYRALSSSLPPLSNSSREFVKRGFAERKEKKKKKSGGRRREGMCPKRRMHAETRKRYIRGLAAGDGRAGPSFFYLYV